MKKLVPLLILLLGGCAYSYVNNELDRAYDAPSTDAGRRLSAPRKR
ncbi:MAG: hypothetical protein HYY16_02320 [Planctomycetes bacterium]|nr:hypothetical protein [Planctomycetota bacterium]